MFHSLLLAAALGATGGIFMGVILRYFRKKQMKKDPTYRQRLTRFASWVFSLLSRSLYMLLGLCLIWTVYFMVLGIADKSMSDYAANSSTLIVSVATIFSIIIAFYEFLRKDKKN